MTYIQEAAAEGYRAGYSVGLVAWLEAQKYRVNPYDHNKQPPAYRAWSDAWLQGREERREQEQIQQEAI